MCIYGHNLFSFSALLHVPGMGLTSYLLLFRINSMSCECARSSHSYRTEIGWRGEFRDIDESAPLMCTPHNVQTIV